MQASHGLEQRDQRTAAGGIDRDARPFETEHITDSANASAVRKPGPLELFDHINIIHRRDERVILSHDPHKHADVGIGQRIRRDPGIFEGSITILQQHPMLRINPAGFLIGNVKERRVEVSDVVEKATFSRVHFPRLAIGTVKLIHVPAVSGNLANRINAVHQVLPKLVDAVGTWESAAHSDDGYVFANANRLVGRLSRDRSSRFGGIASVTGHQFENVIGNRVDGRIVKQHRWTDGELIAKHLL